MNSTNQLVRTRSATFRMVFSGFQRALRVLLITFQLGNVGASYFVDAPDQKLFTPPDNYVFAVQLNQLLSFDVTGDYAA